mgnify:CR=1 FL=1
MAMELAEFLDREAGTSEEQRGQFIIDDDQKANWALRKIRQLQEKRKANIQLAEAEIERINTWLKEVNGDLEQSIDYFTGLLEGYHRQVLEQDPKAKTIKLPYGKLKMRAQQPKFVRDDDKLLAWMKKEWPDIHPYYIKITERPDWKDLKDFLEVCGDKMVDPESGLIVEGVEVIAREPKFSLEVK